MNHIYVGIESFLVLLRETIDKSSAVFKFLSVTVVLDGLQTCGNSVIRSIGGQSKGLIISFIGFYLIGLPIGAYLLLKTQLKVLGKFLRV